MRKFIVLPFIVLSILLLSGCGEEVIPDTEEPVINLIGEEVVYLLIGDEYIDEGVSVVDQQDDDPTLIVSMPEIDTSNTNVYYIFYNAYDESGNLADEVMRTVFVSYNEPGIITSFTYESIDLIGVSIMVFDINHVLVNLHANLYEGDTLIDSVEITENSQSFQFTGLVSGIDYQLVVEGDYELGSGQAISEFSKAPVTVGVYRRVSEDLRAEINNDVKFEAIQNMVYLPYDTSNYNKTKLMILSLANLDEEVLVMFDEYGEKIIFSNDWINGLYEFFIFRDTINIPVIHGYPSAVMIGYSGTSINVTMQLTGMMFYNSSIYFYHYDAFEVLYEAEASGMYPSSRYKDSSYAFFIEAFAYYYFSETSNQELLDNAPLTYEFIENLISETIDIYNVD